ncbi:Carbohydrate acetyl esterase/feruloyl esterase precursor [Luteitalea pratensis]|uniref:Carbohydrate acetyl esterase/feruloyl esterase n=1 Tax=Luteitalea pratensis TaxID=1855912 RepID=A0A143PVU6_LUTPR|nr:sialate O-acetylesterase [Luteitalea pratensis]AMY12511.1 Carbohydrate acetyl esterase/feruloyl esterase precursor [Luteitalea pratensis]
MRRIVLTLLGIAVLATTGVAQSPAVPATGSMDLFLLVGQSNMAGRGRVESQDTAPIPHVLMLDRQRTWVPAVDPMHFDKPIAGVGLGRSFAARIADSHPGVTIGLIPAAVGGSPIDAWQPGVYYEPTKSHPWDDAIARARVALASGTLKAILWHQGESDATADLAPGYEAKLHDLIARLRTALDAPDVPFIVGQLGQYPDVPWDASRRIVDAAHRSLPGKVRRTAFVSSDGLVHGGDKVHFDTPSLRELGHRYADAYLSLSARP